MRFTLNYTENSEEWRLMLRRIKLWSNNAFLHKNDLQSVANGGRRRIEIKLR